MDTSFERYVSKEEFSRLEQRLEKLEQEREKKLEQEREQRANEIDQTYDRLSKQIAGMVTSVARWSIGLFVGSLVFFVTAGWLYVNFLLNLKQG